MIETVAIRKKIKLIRKKLLNMLKLPEKWESVYLYASVIVHPNKLETGEMFFYYIPKGIVKKNPVNVYEIPERFDIYEDSYLKLADDLYESIKDLRKETIFSGDRPWTNITLSIVKGTLKIEFNYDDLLNSEYTSYERHLIWRYRYLDMSLSSYNRKERKLIVNYMKLNGDNLLTSNKDIYQENLYSTEDKKINENYEKAKELEQKEQMRKMAQMANRKNNIKFVEEPDSCKVQNQLITLTDAKNKMTKYKSKTFHENARPEGLNDYLTVRNKEIEKAKLRTKKMSVNNKISKKKVYNEDAEKQGLKVTINNDDERVIRREHKPSHKVKVMKKIKIDDVDTNSVVQNTVRRKRVRRDTINDGSFKEDKVHILLDSNNDFEEAKLKRQKRRRVDNSIAASSIYNNANIIQENYLKRNRVHENPSNKVHIILDSDEELYNDNEIEPIRDNRRVNTISSVDRKIVRKKKKSRRYNINDDFEDNQGQNQILNFDD